LIPLSGQWCRSWWGATIVGSIETVWAGTVTPPREGIIKRWTYPEEGAEGAIVLEKGEEMGRFKLGSTVINLFTPGQRTVRAAAEQRHRDPHGRSLRRNPGRVLLPLKHRRSEGIDAVRLIITLLLGCLLAQPVLAATVPTETQLKQELKQAESNKSRA
jgi:hypothetical protein